MKNKNGYIDFKLASPKVFEHFLGHLYPGGFLVLGRKISNPFLKTPQETPSFNVLQARDNSLIFYDFVTGDKGNCVTFVATFKGISRIEAIREIRKITSKRNGN